MDVGLFSKGGSGHSVRTIGSSHHSKSVGSFHNGYVRGIGHTIPESTSGLQHNAKIEKKINELQNKFYNTKSDD